MNWFSSRDIQKFGHGSLFYLISRDYSRLNPEECVSVLIPFLSKPTENVIYKVEEVNSLRCAGKDDLLVKQFKDPQRKIFLQMDYFSLQWPGLVSGQKTSNIKIRQASVQGIYDDYFSAYL